MLVNVLLLLHLTNFSALQIMLLVFFCSLYPVYFVWDICQTPFTAKLSLFFVCLPGRMGVLFYASYVACIELNIIIFIIVRLQFCFIDLFEIPETSPSRINWNQTGDVVVVVLTLTRITKSVVTRQPPVTLERGNTHMDTPGQVGNGAQEPAMAETQRPTPRQRGAAVFRIPDRDSALRPPTRR